MKIFIFNREGSFYEDMPSLYHDVIVMIVKLNTFDTMWKFKALFVICVSNISLMCIFSWIFVKLKFSIPIYHQSIAWFYAHWRIKLDTLNTHHLFRCTCLILHKNMHCLVPKIWTLHIPCQLTWLFWSLNIIMLKGRHPHFLRRESMYSLEVHSSLASLFWHFLTSMSMSR